METILLTGLIRTSLARFGKPRTYGSPRHLSDYMLKDIGVSADEIGITRKR